MFTRYVMRQLYNFISTSSFYFVATSSKVKRFFFSFMFYFTDVSLKKVDFFYEGCIAFGLDNFTDQIITKEFV